jgi:small neutral amino acid transporter SnatA (MarC family)
VVGTAGTAGMFLVLAAIASSLLAAIDVSPPTLLVGAGLVLMIGAVKDLLVGAPAPEPALRGWGAAVVPVAIPSVARPQVGLLALAAGGHYGLLPLLVGAVTLVVAVGLLTWWAVGGEPLRVRVLRWGAVLAAVLTVGAGAVLAVEGVFAV